MTPLLWRYSYARYELVFIHSSYNIKERFMFSENDYLTVLFQPLKPYQIHVIVGKIKHFAWLAENISLSLPGIA
jgi:hypothetical protein